MHIAKCEGCEKEVEFETYKYDWSAGWSQTGRSQWGKKYHRQAGYGWWCPECNAMPEPITLQGYSYPFATLQDVIAYEARQGRKVTTAIQHAGGWTVAEGPACCWDDEWSEKFLDLQFDNNDQPTKGAQS